MLPKLSMAIGWPISAAVRYQSTASSKSRWASNVRPRWKNVSAPAFSVVGGGAAGGEGGTDFDIADPDTTGVGGIVRMAGEVAALLGGAGLGGGGADA